MAMSVKRAIKVLRETTLVCPKQHQEEVEAAVKKLVEEEYWIEHGAMSRNMATAIGVAIVSGLVGMAIMYAWLAMNGQILALL